MFPIALLLTLLTQSFTINALTTYYVDVDGSDTNNCGLTAGTPCSSIGYALYEIDRINTNDNYEIRVFGANSTYCQFNKITYPTSIIFEPAITSMNDWLPDTTLCMTQMDTLNSSYIFTVDSSYIFNVSISNLYFENISNGLLIFSGTSSHLECNNCIIDTIDLKNPNINNTHPLFEFSSGYLYMNTFNGITQTDLFSKQIAIISATDYVLLETCEFTNIYTNDITAMCGGAGYIFNNVTFRDISLNQSTFISSKNMKTVELYHCTIENIELGSSNDLSESSNFIYTPTINMYNTNINNIYINQIYLQTNLNLLEKSYFIHMHEIEGINIFENTNIENVHDIARIIFIGFSNFQSAKGTMTFTNCKFNDISGYFHSFIHHGTITLNTCKTSNVFVNITKSTSGYFSKDTISIFSSAIHFISINSTFDNIWGDTDTVRLMNAFQSATLIETEITNFHEGYLVYGDFQVGNGKLEIQDTLFENIYSDPTGTANLIFTINKHLIVNNCIMRNMEIYSALFYIMTDDYSFEPNNVNLTNSIIENVDARGVRTVNELIFFGFQGYGSGAFYNGFAHNVYAHVDNISFTTTYQMVFARCIDQTPVIISITNSDFDGPLAVLFASGNIETYIDNINIRSTQYFPWTTSVTIGKIYNSIEVDPIIFNGKGATLNISNINLQLITICGIGNYELFGFYLNQLGIWCDVNTVFLSNYGTAYVTDINIGTNYDKNDWIDAYNGTYVTIGAMWAPRMPGAFPIHDDYMNIFFNLAGAYLEVENIKFLTAVYRIATNQGKMKINNVIGAFTENQILEPLDVKFHKFFSNYGELELTNSHLRGTHVGIEFFKDSKSYLNNIDLSQSIWGLWIAPGDKATNITFENVKIHEIGPYHADILFIWEVTSNWCNGMVLTLSTLSSKYIEISNSHFNYTSPFGFFKIIDTDYLLIDNTQFYVDGYNNWEYNKDKYFYSADYSLYPWSFHQTPSQFIDTVIYRIEQEVEKIGFSFIKIGGNTVARITNSEFYQTQQIFYHTAFIHFDLNENINRQDSCLTNNIFFNNALRLSGYSKVVSCYHYETPVFPDINHKDYLNETCWIELGPKNTEIGTNKNRNYYINTVEENIFSAITIEDFAYLHSDNDHFEINSTKNTLDIVQLTPSPTTFILDDGLNLFDVGNNENVYQSTVNCQGNGDTIHLFKSETTQTSQTHYYIIDVKKNHISISFDAGFDCGTGFHLRMTVFNSNFEEIGDCPYCGYCWAKHAFSVSNIKTGIYYLRLTGPNELPDWGEIYGDYAIALQCVEIEEKIQINDKWSAISMRGGMISITDTYLDYTQTIIRVAPKCESNCMELVNGSYNAIRQTHIDCRMVNTSNILFENEWYSNVYDIFDISEHILQSVNAYLPSTFEIILNDNNIYPNELLNISYNILDEFGNKIINKFQPDVYITLSSKDIDLLRQFDTAYGYCDACEAGIQIGTIKTQHIGGNYSIDVEVKNNLLIPNPSSFIIYVTQCEPGYGVVLDRCDACKEGTFSLTNNTQICRKCDANLEDVICKGKNSIVVAVDHWIAIQGQYDSIDDKLFNKNSNLENDDYYEFASTVIATQCPNGMCCKKLGGCDYSKDDICAKNRDPSSPLCGACLPGYSETMGSQSCDICDNHYEMLLIPLFFSLLIGLWFVRGNRVISKNEKRLSSKDITKSQKDLKKIIVNDEKFGLTILFFKPLVYYMQGLSYIISQSGIQLYFVPLLQLFNLSLDVFTSSSSGTGYCFINGLTAVGEILLNLVVIAFLSMVLLLCWIVCRWKGITIRWGDIFWKIVLFFIGTVMLILSKLLACREIGTSGYYVHYFYGNVQCYDATWWCVLFILFGLFGVIGAIWYKLYKQKPEHRYDRSNPLFRLCRPFKHDKWYWEFVLLGRRFALSFLTQMILFGNTGTNLTLLSLLCLFGFAQVFTNPFLHEKANRIEAVCIYFLIIILVAVNMTNIYDETPGMLTFVLTLSLFTPIIMFGYQVYIFIKLIKTPFDKIVDNERRIKKVQKRTWNENIQIIDKLTARSHTIPRSMLSLNNNSNNINDTPVGDGDTNDTNDTKPQFNNALRSNSVVKIVNTNENGENDTNNDKDFVEMEKIYNKNDNNPTTPTSLVAISLNGDVDIVYNKNDENNNNNHTDSEEP